MIINNLWIIWEEESRLYSTAVLPPRILNAADTMHISREVSEVKLSTVGKGWLFLKWQNSGWIGTSKSGGSQLQLICPTMPGAEFEYRLPGITPLPTRVSNLLKLLYLLEGSVSLYGKIGAYISPRWRSFRGKYHASFILLRVIMDARVVNCWMLKTKERKNFSIGQ